MGAFAIGTLPVLFGIGMGASYAPAGLSERAKNEQVSHCSSKYSEGTKTLLFKKIVGVLIIFFALYSINSGLILSGSKYSLSVTHPPKNIQEAPSKEIVNTKGEAEEVQIVQMDVDYVFFPTVFRIKKDIPVRWEINVY